MTELQVKKPETAQGYYWQTTDDGPCYGPFETDQIARDEFWHDGTGEEMYNEMLADEGPEYTGTKEEWLANYEYVSFMKRPAISTDIFNADLTLESFEEKNEEAVWFDAPPDWPQDAKRELEVMLADALFRWVEKHDAWNQFRALS